MITDVLVGLVAACAIVIAVFGSEELDDEPPVTAMVRPAPVPVLPPIPVLLSPWMDDVVAEFAAALSDDASLALGVVEIGGEL